VVDGIPRIFVGEMRRIYETDFSDFLAEHQLSVSAGDASRETRDKLATRESFGYEWTHFHEMLPEWEENARFYFEPVGGPHALENLLVLDGGCGKGRHSYYALKSGARLIAVDFSRAVEVARRNCSALAGERLFVQADLMSLPFEQSSFDLVYSFGVLHHLPDPEAGYRRLVALVKTGGRMLVYLYHALEGQPVKQAILSAVNAAREVTTRMPHRYLLPLTTALGYGLYGGVVLPYKVLSQFSATRSFAESLPLKFYARYPVRVIVNDQFDRFSAPLENRYTRAEVQAWLDGAALVDTQILGGAGWRAIGRKA
jgi:SAM-dependent methyltransferase